MHKFKNVAFITILILMFLVLFGCGDKAVTVDQKQKVISKKIVKEKTINGDSKAEKHENKSSDEGKNKTVIAKNDSSPGGTANENMTQDVNKEENPNKIDNEEARSNNSDGEDDNKNLTGLETDKNSQPEVDSNDEERRKAAELLATIHQEVNNDVSGRERNLDSLANPFLPLFSDAPVPSEKNAKKRKRKEHAITPITKVDLSQLKLVATLRASSGNKALVEDSTGKGYVIDKGTLIGINFGKVVEITNNSVVVDEEIETMTGNVKIQRREIKLQKAPGE